MGHVTRQLARFVTPFGSSIAFGETAKTVAVISCTSRLEPRLTPYMRAMWIEHEVCRSRLRSSSECSRRHESTGTPLQGNVAALVSYPSIEQVARCLHALPVSKQEAPHHRLRQLAQPMLIWTSKETGTVRAPTQRNFPKHPDYTARSTTLYSHSRSDRG